MLAVERRARIARMVESRGTVRVSDLAPALDVAPMTVRRDLQVLEHEGVLLRVHGGAVSASTSSSGQRTPSPDEPPFSAKLALAPEAKRAIARVARTMVQPGMSIALSAGSTTFALAQQLLDCPGLTVVTNSTDACALLQDHLPETSQVVVTGGVPTASHALVGPLSETALAGLSVDIVFHGFHGFDPRAGFTCPNLDEVRTAQAMIASGRRLVALVDHTKFGVVTLAKVAELARADTLVVDAGLSDEQLAAVRQRVAEVQIAEP